MAAVIDELTKQQILDTAQIFDVVSDFVSLRRRGAGYVGLCPFHADRSPSFYVTPSKNICKCFACGEGGTPLNFIRKHEQLSYTEALKYLANKYGIPIREREETDEERRAADERQSLFIINEFARNFYHDYLFNTRDGQHIGQTYFTERGIRHETIEKFGLGYSGRERSAFCDAAIKKGYRPDYLTMAGYAIQYDNETHLADRFRERVLFPVFTVSGKVVAMGGRILGKSDKAAKYINSPESPIYSKSRELYGLFQAKRAISRDDKCYLVEGYLDVLQMYQCGIENVVASSGTALTVGQVRLIRRFSPHVTLLYDGDTAGIKAAVRGVDLLLEEGMQVRVVLLPEGEDPDSFARSRSIEDFRAYLNEHEQDFISFKTDLLLREGKDDPLRRASLVTDLVKTIARIPDAISRSVYVQSTAQQLAMDEGLLLSEVRKHRGSVQTYRQPPVGSSTPAAATPTAPSETPRPTTTAPRPYERELLRLVLRHGAEQIIIESNDADGRNVYEPLATYVYEELLADEVEHFGTELFCTIISEAAERCRTDGFDPARYFPDHENREVRELAVDLLTDYYALSRLLKPGNRYEEDDDDRAQERRRRERLDTLLRRATTGVYEVKNAFILDRITTIHRRISEISAIDDSTSELHALVCELQELNALKVTFAKALGERTIL